MSVSIGSATVVCSFLGLVQISVFRFSWTDSQILIILLHSFELSDQSQVSGLPVTLTTALLRPIIKKTWRLKHTLLRAKFPVSSSHDFTTWLSFLRKQHFTCFQLWLSGSLHPPFSLLYLHRRLTLFCSWNGLYQERSTTVQQSCMCVRVCVWVCQWDEVRANVWPIQGPGSGSCLRLSSYIPSPLLPSSMGFPAPPSVLWLFLSVTALSVLQN